LSILSFLRAFSALSPPILNSRIQYRTSSSNNGRRAARVLGGNLLPLLAGTKDLSEPDVAIHRPGAPPPGRPLNAMIAGDDRQPPRRRFLLDEFSMSVSASLSREQSGRAPPCEHFPP